MDKKVLEVLKKSKKAISLDKICEKLGVTGSGEREDVERIINDYVSNYSIIKTPNNNYVLMGKTSFRKGRFYANRDGSGKVVVITDYLDRDGNHVVNRDEYPVEKESALGAIDGDEVIVDISVRRGTSSNVITEIIGRELQYVAGEVYRIGEDQLFYCLQRGISEEDAISMIVNGFCKDVFSELPLEFALEAQKIIAISLEHSVG